MIKKIIIFGTGGNCIDILDTINEINAAGSPSYECVGFLDDDEHKWGREFYGVRVLGPLSTARDYRDCVFVNGIGSSANFWRKKEIIAQTGIPRERFETIVHPTASVSRMARLGHGVVVFQNVTITTNATVGDHVIILPASVISHDDVIGDYTCITGGVCISGGVQIGHSCYLGTNSSIRNNLIISEFCLIGMGSVVLHNVPANSVVVGQPARFLKKLILAQE